MAGSLEFRDLSARSGTQEDLEVVRLQIISKLFGPVQENHDFLDLRRQLLLAALIELVHDALEVETFLL